MDSVAVLADIRPPSQHDKKTIVLLGNCCHHSPGCRIGTFTQGGVWGKVLRIDSMARFKFTPSLRSAVRHASVSPPAPPASKRNFKIKNLIPKFSSKNTRNAD